jgi:hypothetical protein
VTDIFFSYSNEDRERVRPIYEALTAVGFEIFWDLQIPAGKDWDTFIKEQLTGARSAIVFWSLESIASDNVRHEATVAKEQRKLVPVLLDPLRVDQFPMGLFTTQAARLYEWSGNGDDPEWKKLLLEIENKAIPAWAGRRMENLAAELRAESQRRETAEAKEDGAEARLRQEIQKQGQLRRDRHDAQAEMETARAELSGLKEALDAGKAQNSDMAGRLASAESLAASARKRFPAWALLVGIILALGVGASVAYFQREAVWTEREARALSDAGRVAQEKIDAETAAKAEAVRGVVEAEGRVAKTQLQVAELTATLLAVKKQRVFTNTELKGTVIADLLNAGSAGACQELCMSDSKCKGFTSNDGLCRLYSTISGQFNSPRWSSVRWD